jgi:hypothetical protein
MGDDAHDHQRIVQVLFEEPVLLLRVAPPAHDFRRGEPLRSTGRSACTTGRKV